MCDFTDCEKWKELDCSQFRADIFLKPTCYRPLIEKKADGSKVPCSDGLLLKLLEEMRTETVECLWDHANAEDLDKQTSESMTSRLEDFFNQKIYDIKRKQ